MSDSNNHFRFVVDVYVCEFMSPMGLFFIIIYVTVIIDFVVIKDKLK